MSFPEQYCTPHNTCPVACCLNLNYPQVIGTWRHSAEVGRGDLDPSGTDLKEMIASITCGAGQKMLPKHLPHDIFPEAKPATEVPECPPPSVYNLLQPSIKQVRERKHLGSRGANKLIGIKKKCTDTICSTTHKQFLWYSSRTTNCRPTAGKCLGLRSIGIPLQQLFSRRSLNRALSPAWLEGAAWGKCREV